MTYNCSKYINLARKLNVLKDAKRLEIVDMLSCGRLCACEILEKFDISQPTLSADMKKLEEVGIVESSKEGKNVYYNLKRDTLDEIISNIGEIFSENSECICKD